MIEDCIFCRIVAGQIPSVKLFEDDRTLAFMDINPSSDGHCLIIPKNHSATFFDIPEGDLAAVMHTARKVALAIKKSLTPDGMRVYQLNGRTAGQIVDHFHVHLVPIRENVPLVRHGLRAGDMEKIKALGARIADELV
ncbi:MAG: HIT family protein [Deltaproteobacteria bacterium]|nr:HIT family protein [Deltaproteobacteria bacterium]